MGAIREERVLVVDDNRDAAKLAATLLRLLGQNVETAFDGVSALRVAEQFKPQVAFVDLEMPGMDGFALAQALRRSFGSLLIVALTGHDQLAFKATVETAIFDAIIHKPASLEDLSEILSRPKST